MPSDRKLPDEAPLFTEEEKESLKEALEILEADKRLVLYQPQLRSILQKISSGAPSKGDVK